MERVHCGGHGVYWAKTSIIREHSNSELLVGCVGVVQQNWLIWWGEGTKGNRCATTTTNKTERKQGNNWNRRRQRWSQKRAARVGDDDTTRCVVRCALVEKPFTHTSTRKSALSALFGKIGIGCLCELESQRRLYREENWTRCVLDSRINRGT